METNNEQSGTFVQPVTFEDVMNLASWDRRRDDEEIDDFLDQRERDLERNEAKTRRIFNLLTTEASQE